MTKAQALDKAVTDYLSGLNLSQPPPLSSVEPDVLKRTYDEFDIHNTVCQKDERWKKPHHLSARQIGTLLLAFREIRIISFCSIETPGSEAYDILAVYQTDGPKKGTYLASDAVVKQLVQKISPELKYYDLNEALEWLRLNAPRAWRCNDPNLIPVENGIFDYKAKTLLPFSPDKIFLTKSPVPYIAGIQNPTIHNPDDGTDWDPESWMASLSDDPEIVDLLWKILGAVVRPGVRWDKAAWLYSRSGSNGKGTLCSLARSLAGQGNCASISIDDFCNGGDFALEPLIYSSAIIVDENNVGAYIDRSSSLKAVITGDIVQVNRKYRAPIPCQFQGFMIQCLNDYPKIKDRTGSFARRQLIIPMDKCFTGMERKYIKHDYLHRPEVLQYFLARVLHMDYSELEAPRVCQEALLDYQETNDSLIQFVEDTFDHLQWTVIPFTFLYALYKSWVARMNPSGLRTLPSARTFQDDLISLLDAIPTGFVCPGGKRQKRRVPKKDLGVPEPLIAEYGLMEWMNPIYKGSDPLKRCIPPPGMIPPAVRGICRASDADASGTDEPDDEPENDEIP